MRSAEDTAFYDLHDLAITLREDTLTWFDMDSTQKVLIDELAEGETMMKGYAEAVLALLDDTSLVRIPEEFEIPSERRGIEEPETLWTASSEKVTVYPNPFSNNFELSYALGHEVRELQIEVFDLVGRNVKAMRFGKVQTGQISIGLDECLGLYVLRITADNRQIHQQKLICLGQ